MYHSDFPEKLCSDSSVFIRQAHGAMLKSRPVHQTDYYDISRNLLRIQIVSHLHGCLNTYIFRIMYSAGNQNCFPFLFSTDKCYWRFRNQLLWYAQIRTPFPLASPPSLPLAMFAFCILLYLWIIVSYIKLSHFQTGSDTLYVLTPCFFILFLAEDSRLTSSTV
mgnify:CR=1 FL=1